MRAGGGVSVRCVWGVELVCGACGGEGGGGVSVRCVWGVELV